METEVVDLPLYEYECPHHGRFEIVQKFSDPVLEKCPKCGKPVQKLLSAPAIQFKGSGWYVTDYARKSSGDGKDAGKDAGKEGKKDAPASDKGGAKESSTKESSTASATKTGTTGGSSSD